MKKTLFICIVFMFFNMPVFGETENQYLSFPQELEYIPNDVISWKDDPFLAGYDLSPFDSYKEFVYFIQSYGDRPFVQGGIADYHDTSLYMIGNVSVSVILPESIGAQKIGQSRK